jgi:hypothetical protein
MTLAIQRWEDEVERERDAHQDTGCKAGEFEKATPNTARRQEQKRQHHPDAELGKQEEKH